MKQSFFQTAKNSLQSPWLLGQCWIWGIILLGSFLLAIVFNFTSFPSSQMNLFAYALNIVAISAGGFFTAKKSKQKGWLYGGLQGIIYSALIMMIGFLAFDAHLSIHPLIFVLGAFGFGAVGGMIGVYQAR